LPNNYRINKPRPSKKIKIKTKPTKNTTSKQEQLQQHEQPRQQEQQIYVYPQFPKPTDLLCTPPETNPPNESNQPAVN